MLSKVLYVPIHISHFIQQQQTIINIGFDQYMYSFTYTKPCITAIETLKYTYMYMDDCAKESTLQIISHEFYRFLLSQRPHCYRQHTMPTHLFKSQQSNWANAGRVRFALTDS